MTICRPTTMIQDAMRGAETWVRLAKPAGKNAVLGDAVQHAVGADDGGIDGPGEHQASDHDDKTIETRGARQWPDQVHGQTADGVIEEALRAPTSGMIITAKNATRAVKIRL